jgi:hypothetical protein
VFLKQGYNFKYVMTGDVSFLPTAANIDEPTAPHQAGSLVNKDGTVYLVAKNGLLGLPSWETLESWGYSPSDIITANSADRNLIVIGVVTPKAPEQISPPIAVLNPTPETQNPHFEINTTQLPQAIVGMSYLAKVEFRYITSGTNYASNATFTGLPGGITTGSSSGSNTTYGIVMNNPGYVTLSGTPTTAGTYTVSLNLTDQNLANLTKNFILVVSDNTTIGLTDFSVGNMEIGPKLANASNAIEINKEAIVKFTVKNQGSGSVKPTLNLSYIGGLNPSIPADLNVSSNTCNSLTRMEPNQSCVAAYKIVFDQLSTSTAYGSIRLDIDLPNAIAESDETNNWGIINFDVRAGTTAPGLSYFTPNSGPVGSSFTIYGNDLGLLGQSTTIRFGTVEAHYSLGSGPYLYGVTVPNLAPGVYPVVVSVGTNVTNALNFTVTAPIQPSSPQFTINTADLPAAHVGAAYSAPITFHYTTTGANYATNATFTGLPAGITTGSSSSPNTTYGIIYNNPGTVALSGIPTTAGTYTITLSLTDQYSASATKQFTLTVNPN